MEDIILQAIGFRKDFSTTRAIIDLIESVLKTLDDTMFGCGAFVDHEKTFDISDLTLSLKRLTQQGF